jgi:acyl-coenzyme A synthetase/AMP-(fatty) acid ligase
MLKDSQTRLLVTDGQDLQFARRAAGTNCKVIALESTDLHVACENPQLSIPPKSLAYIVYTSGSTGQPKGVVQDHQYLLHNMMVRTKSIPVYVRDRIAQLASGTANAVTNAFFALLNGAALLPFNVKENGVGRLATWLQEEKISILWISSPLFRNLCVMLSGEEHFSDLRLLRLMSETVYKNDVDLYKKHFPTDCVLVNGLHSSETGPLRYYLVDHNTEIAGDVVPVGYPIEGKNVFLVDENGTEVGPNQVGEIVVRSQFLSPGYWLQPELTKIKFKSDALNSGERLYFTGDLGLMLPDGCLIHKGRKDFRVKVRGYGVDLVEVENTLVAHPGVREAIVTAAQQENGESRIVAYFTTDQHRAPKVNELRSFLNDKLADYMIPAAFVKLDAIPLTPNGKVNRKMLPEPGNDRPDLEVPYIAPRTPIEAELARIWSEVLSLDRVGIHDCFFDLGGHSLAATRVISHVIKHCQIDISLRALLQSPTIAEMAVVITTGTGKKLSVEELAGILAEVESMSDEQAVRLLTDERGSTSTGRQHE